MPRWSSFAMFPFAEPLQHGSRTKVAARAATSWDNPAMDKDRDLLPWIFGGLSMATFATLFFVPLMYSLIHGKSENGNHENREQENA